MGFWRSLLGKPTEAGAGANCVALVPPWSNRNAEVADHFLTVRTPAFYGVATSANKRWVAGARITTKHQAEEAVAIPETGVRRWSTG